MCYKLDFYRGQGKNEKFCRVWFDFDNIYGFDFYKLIELVMDFYYIIKKI